MRAFKADSAISLRFNNFQCAERFSIDPVCRARIEREHCRGQPPRWAAACFLEDHPGRGVIARFRFAMHVAVNACRFKPRRDHRAQEQVIEAQARTVLPAVTEAGMQYPS
jgi:hypothetical protein